MRKLDEESYRVLELAVPSLLMDLDLSRSNFYVPYLISAGVYTPEEIDNIVKNTHGTQGQVRKFLHLYSEKCENLSLLREALIADQLKDLADLLNVKATSRLKSIEGTREAIAVQLSTNETILRLGGVPAAHEPYVHRGRLVTELRSCLRNLAQKKGSAYVLLYGLQGSGKSCLAAEALRDPEIVGDIGVFNRVFWISVDHLAEYEDVPEAKQRFDADLLEKVLLALRLVQFVGIRTPDSYVRNNRPTYVAEATADLRTELQNNTPNSLLVLDDVLDERVIEAFDVQHRCLVVSRNAMVVNDRDGQNVTKMQMSHGFELAESLQLFSKMLHTPTSELPSEAKDLHMVLDGHPRDIRREASLLAAQRDLGATMHELWVERVRIAQDDESEDGDLKDFDLFEFLVQKFGVIAPYYFDMVIFHHSVRIPAQVLQMYWKQSLSQTKLWLIKLNSLSLLNLDYNNTEVPVAWLHSAIWTVLRKYAKRKNMDIKASHAKFLSAFEGTCGIEKPEQFYRLTHDWYLWTFLPYHLSQAGRLHDLGIVLLQLPFIIEKLCTCGPLDTLMDLAIYGKNFVDKVTALQFQRFITGNMRNLTITDETESVDRSSLLQLALLEPENSEVYKQALSVIQGHIADYKPGNLFLALCEAKQHQRAEALLSRLHARPIVCVAVLKPTDEKQYLEAFTCAEDGLVKISNLALARCMWERGFQMNRQAHSVDGLQLLPISEKLCCDVHLTEPKSFMLVGGGNMLLSIPLEYSHCDLPSSASADHMHSPAHSRKGSLQSAVPDLASKVLYSNVVMFAENENGEMQPEDLKVLSCCISPSGSLACATYNDLTIRVFKVLTGKQVYCDKSPMAAPYYCKFSASSRVLVVGCLDYSFVIFVDDEFDNAKWSQYATFEQKPIYAPIDNSTFMATGSKVGGATDRRTRAEMRSMSASFAYGPQMSESSGGFFSDLRNYVVNWFGGSHEATVSPKRSEVVMLKKLSSFGEVGAGDSVQFEQKRKSAGVVDMTASGPLCSFIPDGVWKNHVISVGKGGFAVWNPTSTDRQAVLEKYFNGRFTCLTVSYSGSLVAFGATRTMSGRGNKNAGGCSAIHVFRLTKDSIIEQCVFRGPVGIISCLSFSFEPEPQLLSADESGTLMLWRIHSEAAETLSKLGSRFDVCFKDANITRIVGTKEKMPYFKTLIHNESEVSKSSQSGPRSFQRPYRISNGDEVDTPVQSDLKQYRIFTTVVAPNYAFALFACEDGTLLKLENLESDAAVLTHLLPPVLSQFMGNGTTGGAAGDHMILRKQDSIMSNVTREVRDLALSTDGMWAAVAYHGGSVVAVHVTTKEAISLVPDQSRQEYSEDDGSFLTFRCMFFPKNSNLLAVRHQHFVAVWEISTRRELWLTKPRYLSDDLVLPTSVNGLDLSDDGSYLCVAYISTIVIMDSKTGVERKTYASHNIEFSCVRFSPNNVFIGIGTFKGQVLLWRVTNEEPVLCDNPRPNSKGHVVSSLHFSPDQKFLLALAGHLWWWDISGAQPFMVQSYIFNAPARKDAILKVSPDFSTFVCVLDVFGLTCVLRRRS